mmetsp:Transcript_67657/g.148420  ORF Transcript_67657/g.148420 Transcript_67657/m.148420 type:complete len:233 (-) Transcript_67657:131-829(-)
MASDSLCSLRCGNCPWAREHQARWARLRPLALQRAVEALVQAPPPCCRQELLVRWLRKLRKLRLLLRGERVTRGDLVRRCQSPAPCSRDKTKSHVALRSAQHKCSERWHYKCHAFHRKEEASLHLPPLCIFHKWRLLQTPPLPALPDLYSPLSSRTVSGGSSHRQPSRRNALCIVDSCSLSATISRHTRSGKCACNCRWLPPCRPAPEAANKHHKSSPQLHCKTLRRSEPRR